MILIDSCTCDIFNSNMIEQIIICKVLYHNINAKYGFNKFTAP